MLPSRIRELLKRCLVKDDKRRLRDIGDARCDLDARDATMEATSMLPTKNALARPSVGHSYSCNHYCCMGDVESRCQQYGPGEVLHLDIPYPPNVEPVSAAGLAISPDGQSVTMIGVRDGVRRLYIRRLDRPEATEISDTVAGSGVVFSPDSSSVMFVPSSSWLPRLLLADRQRTILTSDADLVGSVGWGAEEIAYIRIGIRSLR
jgi:hypothetical protein